MTTSIRQVKLDVPTNTEYVNYKGTNSCGYDVSDQQCLITEQNKKQVVPEKA